MSERGDFQRGFWDWCGYVVAIALLPVIGVGFIASLIWRALVGGHKAAGDAVDAIKQSRGGKETWS